MKKLVKTLFITGFIILLPLILFPGIYTNMYFETRVTECEQLINRWNNNANFLLIISITIGALGVIIGVIQKMEFKANKNLVILLGAFISILIIIQSTAFDADRNSYKKYAVEGKVLNRKIQQKLLMDTTSYSLDDVSILEEEIQILLNKFYKLEEKATLNPIAFNMNIFPAVYAQSRKSIEELPEWVNNKPENSYQLFFVSKGVHSSLQKAKEIAQAQAQDMALKYMSNQLIQKIDAPPEEIYQMADKIARSGEYEETHIYRNPNTDLFEYYLLYSLNKSQFENELANLAVKQEINYNQVKGFDKTIKKVKAPSQEYSREQNKAYDELRFEVKTELGEDSYEKFCDARLMVNNGEYLEAIVVLDGIVQQYPDFFMGWYQLALSYDHMKFVEEAQMNYQRCIDTESFRLTPDASIFNDYGYFLYRHQDYENAISLFENALAIDPDFAKAQKNLKATQYHLYK